MYLIRWVVNLLRFLIQRDSGLHTGTCQHQLLHHQLDMIFVFSRQSMAHDRNERKLYLNALNGLLNKVDRGHCAACRRPCFDVYRCDKVIDQRGSSLFSGKSPPFGAPLSRYSVELRREYSHSQEFKPLQQQAVHPPKKWPGAMEEALPPDVSSPKDNHSVLVIFQYLIISLYFTKGMITLVLRDETF